MGRDYDLYLESKYSERRGVNIFGLVSVVHEDTEHQIARLGDTGTAIDADKCPDSGDHATDGAKGI